MDLIDKIINDLKEFVEFFYTKYKYDNRGILKRYRLKSGLNKQLNEEVWCDLFIIKSAYNYCAKLLLIKLWEDNNKIASKLNKEGLEKWNSLVTNIREDYAKLYEITEEDILSSEEFKGIFKKSEYDIYKIDNELAALVLEKMNKYSFKGYSYESIYQIFNTLYTDHKRAILNLQYFYNPTETIDFILKVSKEKENLL